MPTVGVSRDRLFEALGKTYCEFKKKEEETPEEEEQQQQQQQKWSKNGASDGAQEKDWTGQWKWIGLHRLAVCSCWG